MSSADSAASSVLTTTELRERVLAQRRALTESQSLALSEQVCQHFLKIADLGSEFWRGRNVGMYRTLHSAIPGEPNLKSLEKVLREKGAELFFPRVDRVTRSLEFAPASHEDHWTTGAYGLQEPVHHHSAIAPEKLSVIFMPGLAFGRAGERIGMGAGYYDRYLTRTPKAYRIALAYDFQLYPRLEQKAWDQSVHWVITQTESIRLKDILKDIS